MIADYMVWGSDPAAVEAWAADARAKGYSVVIGLGKAWRKVDLDNPADRPPDEQIFYADPTSLAAFNGAFGD